MSKQPIAIQILVAMYRAASRGRVLSESSLSDLVELQTCRVHQLLTALDRAGYVDLANVRLTLSGLTIAVAASRKTNRKALAKAA